MKIKDGFMLREVAGQWVVVPLGERVVEFNGIMTLSESGAHIWEKLQNETSIHELAKALTVEYSVDMETAQEDIQVFITSLREKNLIQD